MNPFVIRPSGLTRYVDCATAWAVDGDFVVEYAPELADKPRNVHVAAAIGTGAHAGVERALRDKAAGRGHDLDRCIAAAQVGLDRAIAKAGGPGRMVWDATSSPSASPEQVARMVKAWCGYRLDALTPVRLIERRLEVEVAPGFVLSGQIDQAFHLPRAVRDLKTGGQEPSPQVQVGSYGILHEAAFGEPVEEIAVDFLQRVPLWKPQPLPELIYFDAEACKAEARRAIGRLIRDVRQFRASGMPLAKNPSSALCSRRWCRAHGTSACAITRRRKG